MSAVADWAEALASWALPDSVLAAADDTPYGWPAATVARFRVPDATETPTQRIVLEHLSDGGTILDIGAGAGRVSLPVAAAGHPLTAVEPNEAMADALSEEAEARALAVRVVRDRWPGAAAEAGRHDVVVSAHVIYDVADIGPFVAALDGAARRSVVVECTPVHPWAPLIPYYRALHGIDPRGPSVDDFALVVAEVVGGAPSQERWVREAGTRFADLQELLAFYRRRLAVPLRRTGELADLIGPDVVERDGWLTLGDPLRTVCTVWWPGG